MPRPIQGRPSYAAALALPRARVAFGAALLARLCYGFQGLALLFTIQNATASPRHDLPRGEHVRTGHRGAGGFLAVRAGSHVSFAIIAAVLLGCALAALRRRA